MSSLQRYRGFTFGAWYDVDSSQRVMIGIVRALGVAASSTRQPHVFDNVCLEVLRVLVLVREPISRQRANVVRGPFTNEQSPASRKVD
jgi:hypothetical protein